MATRIGASPSEGADKRWQIVWTPRAQRWYDGLAGGDRQTIDKVLPNLERHGPTLGRPEVEHIKTSRYHNLKELRSAGQHLRVLFAFDPNRRAVMLVGGDKRGDWQGFYRKAVPAADREYENHLRKLGKEPPCPTRAHSRGTAGRAPGR